jgi:hypothetical protein
MTRISVRLLILLAPVAVAACADREGGASEAQLEVRDLAARQACIAENLALRAADELATLEQLTVISGPLGFQQAYTQHANLRHAAFARMDSALNHSTTAADSTRHVEAARGFQIRAPEPESVEENVIRSYESKFAAIFSDADHPCNWQSELETQE